MPRAGGRKPASTGPRLYDSDHVTWAQAGAGVVSGRQWVVNVLRARVSKLMELR